MRFLPDMRLLVFGLLVYLAILVATFPAERGYAHWQASQLGRPNVQLSGLSGSIWAGRAEDALINGRHLQSLEWHFRPLSLLTGEVGLSWRTVVPDGEGQVAYGEGTTDFGLNGSVDMPRLEARLPATVLASLLKAQAVRPSGLVSINLNRLRWDGQRLAAAEGRVVWNGAGINLLKPLAMGDLALTLETQDGEIKGVISDNGGPLAVEGLVTLSQDGAYQLSAVLSARQGLQGSRDLESALATLQRPGPDGKIRINQSGNLADFGLVPKPAR